ncbi:MAG: hypothetical protein JO337_09980 [Acidimicrobiales bacterium]|nr:hypothetical protein [Acidimicrobiales bacterium]
MTDEGAANEWAPRSTATDAAEHEEREEDQAVTTVAADERPRSARRTAGWTVGRALVVLAVAAAVYPLVVPTHPAMRSRLALLVIDKPGVAAFDKVKAQAGEQDVSQTGIDALTAAAKKFPRQTGLYSVEWAPSQTSAAGVVAFLLPSASAAATTFDQLSTQQLSPDAYKSNSLTRTGTFDVPGVAGSGGSVFSPSSDSQPTLANTAFRVGRVVALSEVIGPSSSAKADSITLAKDEDTQLRRVAPDFTLAVTRYPLVATLVWIAGAVLVAVIVALTPVLWRRRAERRRLAWEEEIAGQVIVGNRVIVKHRR